ncbi:MAG: site-specific recombinase [Clostridia bacterium]|nr:site-specific recombinase [Clostridia bacterium]
MRAAIYARVSTKHQAEKEISLEDQTQKCRELALQLGAEEIVEFVDDGYSGADPNRPALQRLLFEVSKGNFDLVVCYDVDRWARDLADQLVFTEEIERNGARLEFVTTKRGTSPEDELFFQIKGAFAQYERAKIRQRSQIGKYGKARKGKMVTCSRPPYGYRYNMNPDDPQFHIFEPEAEVVRLIYRLVVREGMGSVRIAEYLREKGIPSPACKPRWYPTTITRLVRNTVYAGTFFNLKYRVVEEEGKKKEKLRPREEWVEISVPPIVSRELWEQAQKRLDENWRTTRKKWSKHQGHLLVGRIFCGLCGAAYTASTANSGHGYYRCYRKVRFKDCGNIYLRGSDAARGKGVDSIVWELVSQWIRDPHLLEAEFVRRQQENENERLCRQLAEELNLKQKVLSNLATQKDELLDLRLEGLLSPEELRKRIAAVERKKKILEEEIKTLGARITSLRTDATLDTTFEDYCALIASNLDKLTLEEKRKILDWIGLKVIVYPEQLVINLPVPMTCEGNKFETVLTVTANL